MNGLFFAGSISKQFENDDFYTNYIGRDGIMHIPFGDVQNISVRELVSVAGSQLTFYHQNGADLVQFTIPVDLSQIDEDDRTTCGTLLRYFVGAHSSTNLFAKQIEEIIKNDLRAKFNVL